MITATVTYTHGGTETLRGRTLASIARNRFGRDVQVLDGLVYARVGRGALHLLAGIEATR